MWREFVERTVPVKAANQIRIAFKSAYYATQHENVEINLLCDIRALNFNGYDLPVCKTALIDLP